MDIKTIIIVEDNPDDVFIYKRYLKKTINIENLKTFDFAGKALDFIKSNEINCILLDHHLPDMSGIDFINRLNALNLESPPPIIMLTGSGDEKIAVEALKSGAIDYLIKGDISVDSLCLAVSKAIEKSLLLQKIKEQDIALKQMAYNDYLTGIPNRARFEDLALQSFARAKRNKSQAAVLMIDLDGFKAVNDTYGHDAGDQLLKNISSNFKNVIRSNDTIARLGGDEFAMVLEDINIELLGEIANKIISASQKEETILGNTISISCSIGVAVFPKDGIELNELIKKADLSLYQAKRDGKGKYVIYIDKVQANNQ